MTHCLHCALPLPGEATDEFCCAGCRAVHTLLHERGLARFYALRTGPGLAVDPSSTGRHAWLEELRGPRIELDVQGIHCAGCVWLLQTLFERAGGGHMELNPTLGRWVLHPKEGVSLPRLVEDVESFGYRLGPAGSESASGSDNLLIRLGICTALAGNAMFYALATYFGLRDGPVHTLLGQLSYAAALLAVLIGGSVFLKTAWRGLRQGLLVMDLPIALGIVLAFVGTSWSYFAGVGGADYVDTLTIFIALMLAGRWLQERTLERNRRRLLEDEGVSGLRTRVVEAGVVHLVACDALREGDALFVGTSDLVPVRATLEVEHAHFSLEWIDGESEPRRFEQGATVPAGAFLLDATPCRLRAEETFADSGVRRLLLSQRDDPRAPVWWQRVSLLYVSLLLAAATIAFGAWAYATDLARALDVTTAVLVVSCPCAFGIAAPLAYELAAAALRRRGLYVMRRGVLDRLRDVRHIVFDKTGTLTTGSLRLTGPSSLDALAPSERDILRSLAHATAHPKSQAVARALPGEVLARDVREVAGCGVELRESGHVYRLGAPRWALARSESRSMEDAPGTDLVWSVDGRLRLAIRTEETLRPDARGELDRVKAWADVVVLSGDRQGRVDVLAKELGLAPERARGDMLPEEKAAFVRAREPERTLMVGDGLNDLPAAMEASCSGTAAIERPVLASRCDFYFTTPGLAPITAAIETSHALGQTLRRVLSMALAYNLLAIGIAMAGWMRPWWAAVLMPASSLLTIAYVLARHGPRRGGERPRVRDAAQNASAPAPSAA